MVFSSMVFLSIFLPAVFLLHLLISGNRRKNVLLLIASLIFYAYGEPVYVLLMIVFVFINYLGACGIGRCAPQSDGPASSGQSAAPNAASQGLAPSLCVRAHKKVMLTFVVAADLGLLIFFKYLSLIASAVQAAAGLDISVPDVRMPIGISFFTFQAMSYVIDVYRGRTKAQKNFFKVLLYISFFPQLVAGPIVKYHDIAEEIDGRKVDPAECASGFRRFSAGLCKKVLIANTMGAAADQIFNASAAETGCAGAWLAAVSYMLQIYFDFSGYSDMAIGMGTLFGFHFKENFDYPYISGSVREFWRRWHISLSGWFKEYLYIPLGGNRKGKIRTMLNKMIVFLCTGIWHGASVNFIFWGVYHGFFLILEECIPAVGRRRGKRKPQFIDRISPEAPRPEIARRGGKRKQQFAGRISPEAPCPEIARRGGKRKPQFIGRILPENGCLAIVRLGRKIKRLLRHIYVLLTVCVGFVFFRADTMGQALFLVKRMFLGGGNTRAAMSLVLSQLTPVYLVTLAAAVIASAPVLSLVKGKKGWEVLAYGFSVIGLLLCILSLAGGTYNPFIYFRF